MTSGGAGDPGPHDDWLAGGGPLAARLEQVCSGCDGTGTLASEAWERWYAESTRLVALVSDADREPVLRTLVNQLLQRHEQERPTEARERRCDDCGGAGTVPTEEGQELLAFLRRHRER